MNDRELLEAIQKSIEASEERMSAKMVSLENRLQAKIEESQFALKVEIAESETRMSALIENKTQTAINVLTEGYQGLSEKLGQIDEIKNDMDEMTGYLVAIENATVKNTSNIIELQKAKAKG